ncbi:MAG: Ig-like domain-containing protein, partial [Thermoanaerobaculia bacterium]
VAGVTFYLDGSPLGVEDTSAPYAVSWDTTTATNGSRTLTAVARDAAGNSTTSAAVQVTVANSTPDTTAPSVAITSPSGGATVNGTVQVSASASDNVGVAGVRFYLDGSPLGVEDTTAPFAIAWDTTTTTNALHTLTAVARDAAGNSTTSVPLSIFVSNGLQGPYLGTPSAIPGRFECEDFDLGGEGVGYHDAMPGNVGGYYRTDEDVDIINPYAFGYVVNNFQTGEWLTYTINVSQTGTYRIEALVSSMLSTSRFHIEVDGTDKTGLIDVPNTGSWGSYRWVGTGSISLSAGRHVLKIYADAEYFNIDMISSSLEAAAVTTTTRRRSSGPRH